MNKLSKYLFYLAVLSIPFYVLRFKILLPTTITEVLIYLAFLAAVIASFCHPEPRISVRDKLREGSSEAGSDLRPRFLVYLKYRLYSFGFRPRNALGMTQRDRKIFFASLVFLFAALIAALHDPSRGAALGIWKAYFFDGILLAATYYLLKDKNKIQKTANLLFVGGVALALITLIVFLSGVKNADGRLLDLAKLNPNYLGMYLVPILVIGVSKIFERNKELFWRYLELVGALVLVAAIILTGSRGAYLAAFVSLTGLLLSKTKFFKPAFAALIIVVLIAGAIVFRPSPNDLGRTGSSSNIRYLIWTTSFEIVGKNPVLGVGLNNFQPYFTELTKNRVNYPEFIAPVALTAHNIYLHLLVIGGPLLLISFLYLVYQSKLCRFNNIYSFALFAILIYGLVDTPFFRNDLSALFWILLVLSAVTESKIHES